MTKIYPGEPTVRRMSQKGPNIQQIRKPTEEGQKIRNAFIESMERDPTNDMKEVILPPGTDPFEEMFIGKAFKAKVKVQE